MRIWLCLSILLITFKYSASKVIMKNVTWGSHVEIKCDEYESQVYIMSATAGCADGKNFTVGEFARKICNKKWTCNLEIVPGIRLSHIKCKLSVFYADYICVNRGASVVSLIAMKSKASGYMEPSESQTGLVPRNVNWTYLYDNICTDLPRYAEFRFIDINLDNDCSKHSFTIKDQRKVGSQIVSHVLPLCSKDVEAYSVANRTYGIKNFTSIAFEFKNDGSLKSTRGFFIKFIVMQCDPVEQIPNNTRVSYKKEGGVIATIQCASGFKPWPKTPSEVQLKCGGTECFNNYCEINEIDQCNPTWTPHNGNLQKMRCVDPATLPTASSTSATTAPSTINSAKITKNSSQAANASSSSAFTKANVNSPSSTPLPELTVPSDNWPTEHTTEPQVVAGIIGTIVGFVVCFLVGVLVWVICRKSRMQNSRFWCCRCLDGLFFEKSCLQRHQSRPDGSVEDSTMAVRYRDPRHNNTLSTRVDISSLHSNPRSSLAASSTLGSISFPSFRRNKKKTLPLPSELGVGPYDEMAPLFVDNRHDTRQVRSPSVETYLEPNRRPSTSSRGATGITRFEPNHNTFSTFHPKPRSSTEYQVYDETRSSRNALDRFDGPLNDPRRSQALQSNHYYCRDDQSVSSDGERLKDGECDSEYETLGDGHSSVNSTPRETRRFPPAPRNEYVQPPALPERPAGMDRNSRHQNFVTSDEEDGYQPVNVKGRIND